MKYRNQPLIDWDDIRGKYTLRALGSQLLPGRAEIKNTNLLATLHCSQLCILYYLSLSLGILKIVKLVISFPNRTVNQNLLIFTCTEYSSSTQRLFKQTILESLPAARQGYSQHKAGMRAVVSTGNIP